MDTVWFLLGLAAVAVALFAIKRSSPNKPH